ncbi:MAG TPA: hypothetical protein PK467_18445 [Candidatus Wallbacteria bacterium]|nr:hypothetical protein [Candidatus Wallbacteria bacterium]
MQRAFEFSISDGEQRIKPTDYINKLISEGWVIEKVIFPEHGRVFVLANKKDDAPKKRKASGKAGK